MASHLGKHKADVDLAVAEKFAKLANKRLRRAERETELAAREMAKARRQLRRAELEFGRNADKPWVPVTTPTPLGCDGCDMLHRQDGGKCPRGSCDDCNVGNHGDPRTESKHETCIDCRCPKCARLPLRCDRVEFDEVPEVAAALLAWETFQTRDGHDMTDASSEAQRLQDEISIERAIAARKWLAARASR